MLLSPAPAFHKGKIPLAVVAVIAGAIASLARTTGAGALDTVWAEDGQLFLAEALSKGFWESLTTSYSGYYHLVPRLFAQFNTLLPADWIAAAFAVEAALTTSALALLVYVASAGLLKTRLQRVLVSAPLILAPLAQDDLYNTVTMLRWPLMYAVFWIILWVPSTRAGRIVGPVVVALAAFSDNVLWIFVPLLIARLWMRGREPETMVNLASICLGTLSSVIVVLTGASERGVEPRLDPVWAAGAYVLRPVSQLFMGVRWVGLAPSHDLTGLLPTMIALGILAGVVFFAARRITSPNWMLAIVATACSIAIYLFCTMVVGQALSRYSAPAALLLLTAVVALLTPGKTWPLYGLATLMLVVAGLNFRLDGGRTEGPSWSEGVTVARGECAAGADTADILVSPPQKPWVTTLPCTYLR